jgi:hypothetical protein
MSPARPVLDLDTFLTAVYCVVDDLFQQHCARRKPRRPGHRPELSDSEVLALALLAQWWPGNSERAFCAYAAGHWRPYFPHLLDPSALNRRVRDLTGVLALLGPLVAERARAELGLGPAPYAVVDGAPVPLMQRCRGERHRVFTAEAGIGKGGPQKDWYYGLKELLVVDEQGFLTGFVLGPANTDERLLLEALLRWRHDPRAPLPSGPELERLLGPTHGRGGHRQGPTGPLGPRLGAGRPWWVPLLGDLGYRGAPWHAHWAADLATVVLTKRTVGERAGRAGDRALVRAFNGARQIVERAVGRLEDQLHLHFPRARSLAGLWARLGAKVAAANVLVYLNHRFGRPPEAHFNPFLA